MRNKLVTAKEMTMQSPPKGQTTPRFRGQVPKKFVSKNVTMTNCAQLTSILSPRVLVSIGTTTSRAMASLPLIPAISNKEKLSS